MSSPLTFVDLFGVPHVEPSVTGLVEVQLVEQVSQSNVNDLIIISPFRSGKPLTLKRFTNLTALADNHDPDRTGDEGVALARATRGSFADINVFGAASILTLRPEGATAAGTIVSSVAPVEDLIQVQTGDYGSHTNNRSLTIEDGSVVGKRVTLRDLNNQFRKFVGDNLGVLINNITYTGNATGTVGLKIVQNAARLSYSATNPVDGELITVNLGQVQRVFEFDTSVVPSLTDPDNIAVSLTTVPGTTFGRFADLLALYFPSIAVEFDPSANTIRLATGAGVTLTPSTGAANFTVSGTTITYTGEPNAGDTLTVVASGKTLVFEFVPQIQIYTEGRIPVTVGTTAVDTATNLHRAITQALDSFYDFITHDSASRDISLSAVEFGVSVFESSAQYTVTALGAPSRLQVRFTETVPYTGTNAADGDIFTLNGIQFEFDNGGGVTSGNIPVQIGATSDDSALNLARAINTTFQGAILATVDTALNIISLSSVSVAINPSNVGSFITAAPLGATDGSRPLDLGLTLPSYKTIDKLVGFINNQNGYDATINSFANKFLLSTAIDVFFPTGTTLLADGSADIKSPNDVTLTGYVASVVDWINTRTRGNYTATEIARGTIANGLYLFSGGATPGVGIADWENAFSVLDANVEEGAILLINSDDPTVMAATVDFIDEQRAKGKWFRAYFGMQPALASGDDVSAYLNISAAIDHSRIRLTMQRVGVFRSDNTIEYLHPVFLAAALAGAASGNLPYKQPLTNKRLRFAGIHPDDEFNQTTRESLIEGGITVIKKEQDRLVVALNVTSSHDPDKRMVRIVSEIDTVDLIDARMRRSFLQFRGKWANTDVNARVIMVRGKVLDAFVADGALSPGVSENGDAIPAWAIKPVGPNGEGHVIYAGVLRVGWQVYIPGELNHVSLLGNAEYQRLAGTLSGGVADQVTTVPVR